MVFTTIIVVLVLTLFFLFGRIIAVSNKNIRNEKSGNPTVLNNSPIKKWSKDEFNVLAFYVIYEMDGHFEDSAIASIAEMMGRSYGSVYRKVSIFNNLDKKSEDLNKLEREVYKHFKTIGREKSSDEVNISIENIIHQNPQ